MTTALRALWQSRSPRERRALRAALVLVAAILLLALAAAALQAREPLRRDVAALRADNARMQQQALELAQLRAMPPPPAHGELLATVQSSIEATSLASGLAQVESPDTDHVVVVFKAVAFADWLRWVEALATRQVRLESCRIEALPASGRVGVTATFVRTSMP